MAQPIIRGIQAVGAVDIYYRYNGNNGVLELPSTIALYTSGTSSSKTDGKIDTSKGVPVCGFRLDGEFIRATQQIASSVQIPILGGGAIALTNNNRSGVLNINATKVSTPNGDNDTNAPLGAMYKATGSAIGTSDPTAYDLVFLAQAQQAQKGGDSEGATISVVYSFCGLRTIISFEGCTIASVDPVGLAGNDAVNYNIQINYLNWTVEYNASDKKATTESLWTTT